MFSRPQALGDPSAPFDEALGTPVGAEVSGDLLPCCLQFTCCEIIQREFGESCRGVGCCS